MFGTLSDWTTKCDEDNGFEIIETYYLVHSTSHQQGFLITESTYTPHEAQRKMYYSWKNDEHFERHLLHVLVKCERQ
jgi:hypothetical protein